MKADFKKIQRILQTKTAIRHKIEDKNWEIEKELTDEEQWLKDVKKLQAKLDDLVKAATKDELFIILTGRYYQGDDLCYYYMDNPSTIIPRTIG
jgi:hypothetical protein